MKTNQAEMLARMEVKTDVNLKEMKKRTDDKAGSQDPS
jgi:hypothetical protein